MQLYIFNDLKKLEFHHSNSKKTQQEAIHESKKKRGRLEVEAEELEELKRTLKDKENELKNLDKSLSNRRAVIEEIKFKLMKL